MRFRRRLSEVPDVSLRWVIEDPRFTTGPQDRLPLRTRALSTLLTGGRALPLANFTTAGLAIAAVLDWRLLVHPLAQPEDVAMFYAYLRLTQAIKGRGFEEALKRARGEAVFVPVGGGEQQPQQKKKGLLDRLRESLGQSG